MNKEQKTDQNYQKKLENNRSFSSRYVFDQTRHVSSFQKMFLYPYFTYNTTNSSKSNLTQKSAIKKLFFASRTKPGIPKIKTTKTQTQTSIFKSSVAKPNIAFSWINKIFRQNRVRNRNYTRHQVHLIIHPCCSCFIQKCLPFKFVYVGIEKKIKAGQLKKIIERK